MSTCYKIQLKHFGLGIYYIGNISRPNKSKHIWNNVIFRNYSTRQFSLPFVNIITEKIA